MENHEFINALRELADFYEARPDMELPISLEISLYPSGKQGMAKVARQMGKCEKVADGMFFRVKRFFGPIQLVAIEYRSMVCEKVTVGKKIVPETVIPAREAQVIPEHEEEVVEWRCPELLVVGGEMEAGHDAQ